MEIKLITSNANYHISNGMVVRLIHTFKNIKKECYICNTDPYWYMVCILSSKLKYEYREN